MSYRALTKMLEKYDLSSADGSYDALREVLQEIVLLGLYDAGFFKHAAFYGGTALRILHQLPRFSEDLDFSLMKADEEFNLTSYQEAIIDALRSYGFEASIEIKKKAENSAIASAFVKSNTLKNLININAPATISHKVHRDQTIKIKLEVDTNPPLSFMTENIIRLSPRAYSINAFTLNSLYAGKIHAILCRAWGNRPKGRDWYDLVWYVANGVKLDLTHLQARLEQSCKYLESQDISIPINLDRQKVLVLLRQRLTTLDIAKAKTDVQPFIKDMRELDLWSHAFFNTVINELQTD